MKASILTFDGGTLEARDDALSVEEPLEIRLDGVPVSVTMRTPGHDRELAIGFLHGEGVLRARPLSVSTPLHNVVDVSLSGPVLADRLKRNFYATSSCGVCGKASLAALSTLAEPLPDGDLRIDPEILLALPARLEDAQATFARTGSLHATALFDRQGSRYFAFEDVGRHNAVDKAIGHALLEGPWPLDDTLMFVSGRTSFEIVQKAVMARIPVVAGVSGPSTLAVDLARAFNVTLVGFVRGQRFNVYSRPERLSLCGPRTAGGQFGSTWPLEGS